MTEIISYVTGTISYMTQYPTALYLLLLLNAACVMKVANAVADFHSDWAMIQLNLGTVDLGREEV